jgi:hypothetical protein
MKRPICRVVDHKVSSDRDDILLDITLHEGVGFTFILDKKKAQEIVLDIVEELGENPLAKP